MVSIPLPVSFFHETTFAIILILFALYIRYWVHCQKAKKVSVRQMQESGLVQFGSHTLDHARLRRLPQEDILRQLRQSKAVLEEKLGVACEAFCYPFGSGGFDKRVRPLVFQAGYLFDFSTKPGINPWPWKGKKTLLRAFPRGGETLTDFYIQITRGKSKF